MCSAIPLEFRFRSLSRCLTDEPTVRVGTKALLCTLFVQNQVPAQLLRSLLLPQAALPRSPPGYENLPETPELQGWGRQVRFERPNSSTTRRPTASLTLNFLLQILTVLSRFAELTEHLHLNYIVSPDRNHPIFFPSYKHQSARKIQLSLLTN